MIRALAIGGVVGCLLATLAAARNTYGSTAVDNRFARLEADPPEVRCGTCTFRGDS